MTRLLALLASAACLTSAASAAVITEQGDAGQTAATAQDATGATRIDGSLIDLGAKTADVDFYRIVIDDPAAFAVTVLANLSEDNDTEILLFDEAFNLVLRDDDDGDDLLSAFFAGELTSAGGGAGTYYLAITIFEVVAAEAGLITVAPDPFQTGSYSLLLDGVAAVPLPAAAWMFLVGAAGLGAARRRSAA